MVADVKETPAGRDEFRAQGLVGRRQRALLRLCHEPGFRPGGHLVIWDFSTAGKPKYVTNHWLPGQRCPSPPRAEKGLEPAPSGRGHGEQSRLPVLRAGGNVAVLDISNIAKPELIFDYSIEPQFKGPHTSMPFFGMKSPNFTPGFGDVRDYIIVCNEASDAEYQGLEVRCMVYMLDVTAWNNPMMVGHLPRARRGFPRRRAVASVRTSSTRRGTTSSTGRRTTATCSMSRTSPVDCACSTSPTRMP